MAVWLRQEREKIVNLKERLTKETPYEEEPLKIEKGQYSLPTASSE